MYYRIDIETQIKQSKLIFIRLVYFCVIRMYTLEKIVDIQTPLKNLAKAFIESQNEYSRTVQIVSKHFIDQSNEIRKVWEAISLTYIWNRASCITLASQLTLSLHYWVDICSDNEVHNEKIPDCKTNSAKDNVWCITDKIQTLYDQLLMILNNDEVRLAHWLSLYGKIYWLNLISEEWNLSMIEVNQSMSPEELNYFDKFWKDCLNYWKVEVTYHASNASKWIKGTRIRVDKLWILYK